ncbi:MAG: class II glutamine amidotransferase [Myxococcaceae bacterium]|nr:class II glutamine amidotransferase [Myxococcaceae bacterium]
MCRLFGFRSNTPATVHRALVTETNSLLAQSREHPDGWGIASYHGAPVPHVVHGLGAAHIDPEFERVSRLLSSHTVVAHVRLASVGGVVLKNAHPFTCGQWAFAHNGTVRNFKDHREAVEALIAPDLRERVRGDTDSERCFFLFLTFLRRRVPTLLRPGIGDVARALAETMGAVAGLADVPGADASSMNFLVSDGELMVVTRRRRTLFVTDGTARTEPPAAHSTLPQLLLASERLSGEGVWHEVPEETVLGVDAGLRFHRWTVRELLAAQSPGKPKDQPLPAQSTLPSPSGRGTG